MQTQSAAQVMLDFTPSTQSPQSISQVEALSVYALARLAAVALIVVPATHAPNAGTIPNPGNAQTNI
jgi:hypothetical protein